MELPRIFVVLIDLDYGKDPDFLLDQHYRMHNLADAIALFELAGHDWKTVVRTSEETDRENWWDREDCLIFG